ncbi:MAG: arsenate reductase ArsC [Gemmatimonadales bacterium]|jgi:arsenate reductase
MSVRVELLVTPDCPHARQAEALVRGALERLAPDAVITLTVVRDLAEAERLAFPGSPTVRINGEDLAGADPGPPAYACRTYEDGYGVPPEWLLEVGILRTLRPRHFLFLCVANSARSQMAEGIARSLATAEVRISSAGSEPSRVNPFAIRALEEIGVDASTQRSKGMDEIRQGNGPPVDAVVTLCAEEVCPAWLGEAYRVHWPLADPAAATGSDEEVLESFRLVRDLLRRRLIALFRQSPSTPFA